MNKISLNPVIIGEITYVEVRPTRLEGLEQTEYCFEIKTDTDLINEWVPINKNENGENIIQGTILDFYLQEVFKVFPETTNFVEHKEVFEFLKGKKVEFQRKPLGKQYLDIPPRKYYVPQKKL